MNDSGRVFPRGLVLGFTMAEIAILVIFVLLLVLAAQLARERKEARDKLEDYEAIDRVLQEENLPAEPDELRYILVERVTVHQDATRWRELVREIETWSAGEPSAAEIVSQLQESAIGRLSPQEIEELLAASRDVASADAHAELEEALEEAGVSATPGELRSMADAVRESARRGMSPGEVRDAIENRDTWKEAVDDSGRPADPEEMRKMLDAVRAAVGEGVSPEQVGAAVEAQSDLAAALDPGEGETPEEALRKLLDDARRCRETDAEEGASLQDRLDQALEERDRERARAESLAESLRALGGGTDHPSCWYQADGLTTAYLLDVVLTSRGFGLDLAPAPPGVILAPSGGQAGPSGRELGTAEEARASLPLDGVRRRQLLTTEDFRRQTGPVHDWSRQHDPECRFFVRVFDRTGKSEKQLYKDRLNVVEQHFYKLQMNDDSELPPGLAAIVEP